eukprot:Ihof_evm1s432 gene=Ihof_evmTU1s432
MANGFSSSVEERIVPQAPNRFGSLSSKQAYESLFLAVQQTVDHHRPDKTFGAVLRHYFIAPLLRGRCGGGVEIGVESLLPFICGALQVFAGAINLHFTQGYPSKITIVDGTLLLAIFCVNVVLNTREEYQKDAEVANRVEDLAEQYRELLHTGDARQWSYQSVDPSSPSSTSIALIHTYRDGVLVNIPANLLVEGDLVLLAAGQRAPGDMRRLDPSVADTSQQFIQYKELVRPVKAPTVQGEDGLAAHLYSRKEYIMMETPLVRDVTLAMDSTIHRPDPPMIQELRTRRELAGNVNFLTDKPSACSPLSPLQEESTTNPSSYNKFNTTSTNPNHELADSETEFPLSYTKIWQHFLDVVCGTAFYTLPRSSSLLHGLGNITVMCATDKEGVLSHPMASAEKIFFMTPQDDTREAHDEDQTDRREKKNEEALSNQYDVENNQSEEDCLRRVSHMDYINTNQSTDSLPANDHDPLKMNASVYPKNGAFKKLAANESIEDIISMVSEYTVQSEVADQYVEHFPVELEMTFDPGRENGLRFMDVNWRNMLSSLKPMGLNVLLNTGCQQTALVTQLADHVKYLTLLEHGRVLNDRRMCLCLLGKEIGFSDRALKMFVRRQQIWTFAPYLRTLRIKGDTDKNTALASKGKLKEVKEVKEGREGEDAGVEVEKMYDIAERESIPHTVSQVVEELRSGTLQLLTEGSPPLVLEMCTELWDGQDIRPLHKEDRRRIMEFYQRVSKSMPCQAFSYRPIDQSYAWFDKNNPMPIEFSTSPSKALSTHSNESGDCPACATGSYQSKRNSSEREDYIGPHKKAISASEKRIKCAHMLQGQIFIGMVASQMQPREYLVKMIDDLDDAGIRFVLFSSKDANSSKAFADKMGLETGWNCHISLKEDSDDHSVE